MGPASGRERENHWNLYRCASFDEALPRPRNTCGVRFLPHLHQTIADDRIRALAPPPPLRLTAATALFLDFDGTLVEIADRPDAVAVPDGLPALLAALGDSLGGRFAVISGRSIASLREMLGPVDVPLAGSHGGEIMPSIAAGVTNAAPPLPAGLQEELARFAKANGGLLVEPKPSSIAVHYRERPEVLEALLVLAEGIASARGMQVKHGRQVIELVVAGSDKGTAVEAFMAMPAFAGATPLFVGDDTTDEDAFRVVSRLGGGGVLAGPLRPTAAHWHLESVSAVYAWLAAALGQEPPA